MLASSIVWILVGSGAVTCAAGLPAFLFPRQLLRIAFGIEDPSDGVVFFARHWGLLIFLVGALVVYSAYDPASRFPILIAAAAEKAVLVGQIFFGRMKRTVVMTAIALGDGLFAVLYVAYLAGL